MRKLASIPFALLLSCSSNEAANNVMNVDDTEVIGMNASEDMNAVADSTPKQPCEAIEGLLATAEDCEDLTALQKDVKSAPAALDAPQSMVRGKIYEVTLVIDRPKKAPLPPPPPATHTCPDGAVIPATETCPPPPPPPPPPPAPEGEDGANAVATVEPPTEVPANETEPGLAAGEAPPSANEVVAELPGEDTAFKAQVGRYMTATLKGSGFDIKLISPDDPMQVIPQGGQGRWQWEVKPTMGGTRRLTVKTQAVGIVDGKPVALGNGDSSQDVTVTVTKWDRFWDMVKEVPGRLDLLTAVLVALGGLVAAAVVIRNRLKGKPKSED